VLQALHRGRGEWVQGQHVREVRRRLGQRVGHGEAARGHAGDLMGRDVLLDRRRGRLDLGEAGAVVRKTLDQGYEVRHAAERLCRVARPLEAQHGVGPGYLASGLAVPLDAGPDRYLVGQTITADRWRTGRQVRRDRGDLAGDRRVGVQETQPQALRQAADGVVADVVVHVVEVAIAQHVERATRLGCAAWVDA